MNIGHGFAQKGIALFLAVSMVLPSSLVSFSVAFAQEASGEEVSVSADTSDRSESITNEAVKSESVDSVVSVDVETPSDETLSSEDNSSNVSSSSDDKEVTEVQAGASEDMTRTDGSITICKVIADTNGNIATNSDNLPAGEFSIELSSFDDHSYVVGTANFSANSFAPTHSIILDGNDAQCVTYENLQLGGNGYFYDTESISGSSTTWNPKYNDQYTTEVMSLADFYDYDVNNGNADGQIVLTHDIADRTLVVLNTYEPVVAPACFAPQTLGDEEYDTIQNTEDPLTLQQILDANGYSSVDADADQTNIQAWNGNSQTVTIKAEYIAKQASRHQVFGYYLNGDEATFQPIFKVGDHTDYPSVPSFAPGQDVTVSIPTSSTIGFAIDSQDISSGDSYILATEISENEDGSDHALVYDLDSDDYLIAFEDLLNDVADYDYNDLVVKVSLTSCGSGPVNTPPTISTLGDNPLTLIVGTPFVDPGATTTDAEDVPPPPYVVTGAVDSNTLGSYVLTYTTTDSGGLSASTTRKVDVVPNSNPTSGSITICKMIVSNNGVIATSPAGLPAGTFGITLNSIEGGATTSIQTAQFSAETFAPNTAILSHNYDADIDNDGDVDTDDLLSVIGNWGATGAADVNGDGIVNNNDLLIVIALWSTPGNPGGDIGDVNGDGIVNVTDLLAVIGAWGQTSGPADINNDGIVDQDDLNIVIATWGLTTNGYDAECITYSNLSFGEYSYNEEAITGSDWGQVRYNDQYDNTVTSLNDFFPFDPTNINSNGGITLSANMSHRTLVVLNTYTGGSSNPEEICGNNIDDDNDGLIDEDCGTGGGGGGGGGSSGGGRRNNGQVLGTQSCDYLHDYLKIDWANDPVEVVKLQVFLRELEGFKNLPVTGVYDQATFDAVSIFQEKYSDDILKPWGYTSKGFTYILTKKKVNEIVCQKMFPLTAMQQDEIQDWNAFVASMGGMGGDGSILFPSSANNDLRDIVVGEISSTSTEDTELANAYRSGNKTATESMFGSILGDMSLRNLAGAIFTLPADRAAVLQCVYYLLMILIAIYILGTILANAQNSSTHTKEQIAQRRLVFFVIGVVLAVLGALWFKIFCLIVPLLVILIILIISLFINGGNKPKTVTTVMTVEKKEDK